MRGGVKELVGKCLLMATLLALSAAAVMVFIPPDREDYLAVIGDKVELLERTASPKIVFVGGSNLAFGLDSRTVERELGYPVVNMGMGFNMGLRFMLDLVRPQIGEGDVVVLVPEYNLFYGLFDGDERLIDVLELYPAGLRYVSSPRQYWMLLRNLPRHIKFKVNRAIRTVGRQPDPDCVYCPRAFNEYGDVTAHLDRASTDVAAMDFLRSGRREVDATAIAALNAFAADVEAAGARIFMLFPCLPRVHYERRQAHVDGLYERLQADLDISLPAPPTDYVYPVEYFYDWVYHLGREGRSLRTARVIADLRAALDAEAVTDR